MGQARDGRRSVPGGIASDVLIESKFGLYLGISLADVAADKDCGLMLETLHPDVDVEVIRSIDALHIASWDLTISGIEISVITNKSKVACTLMRTSTARRCTPALKNCILLTCEQDKIHD